METPTGVQRKFYQHDEVGLDLNAERQWRHNTTPRPYELWGWVGLDLNAERQWRPREVGNDVIVPVRWDLT